jgi:hypothetical protein
MYGLCSLSSGALLSSAQDSVPSQPSATTEESPDARGKAFRPVEGGGDTRSGEVLLTVAYSVMWLMAFGLVVMSMRRQRKLDARITQLGQDVERARKATKAGAGD